LIPLQCRWNAIENFTTIILLEHLAVSHRCDSVIIKLEPPTRSIGFDASEVVPAVKISRVNKHAM
jgi:hypothetical protein